MVCSIIKRTVFYNLSIFNTTLSCNIIQAFSQLHIIIPLNADKIVVHQMSGAPIPSDLSIIWLPNYDYDYASNDEDTPCVYSLHSYYPMINLWVSVEIIIKKVFNLWIYS